LKHNLERGFSIVLHNWVVFGFFPERRSRKDGQGRKVVVVKV